METRNKYILLFLCCSLLGFFSCEEEPFEPALFGTLFGEVLETDDNIAIEGVIISTNPPTSTVETDLQGRFQLENIPVGTYSLRAEKSDFLSAVTSVAIFADQDANVIVRMTKDSLENTAPGVPVNVFPQDGTVDNEVNITLQWSGSDMDTDDELQYDLLLFNSDQTETTELLINSVDTTYELTNLDFNTNYFWQVIVNDGSNEPVYSEVWSFSTQPIPNHRFVFAKEIDGVYDIYSSDEAGNSSRLTNNSASNWRPRMNPLRTKIAFISNIEVNPQIYIMDRDGSNVTQVTTIPISGAANQTELDYSWSPDGSRILYMINSKLYSILLDGTGLTEVAETPFFGFTFGACDWVGLGNKIVARTVGTTPYNSHLVLLDLPGSSWDVLQFDIAGRTGGPSFSIDGSVVLFTHDVSEFEAPDGRQLDARIFTKNVDTFLTVDLSINKPAGTNDLDPRFSPDGSRVIFTNTNNDGISPKNIWVMDIDGNNRTLLFENAEMAEWK